MTRTRPRLSAISETGIGLRVLKRDGKFEKLIDNPVAEAEARARVEADNARFEAEQAAKKSG